MLWRSSNLGFTNTTATICQNHTNRKIIQNGVHNITPPPFHHPPHSNKHLEAQITQCTAPDASCFAPPRVPTAPHAAPSRRSAAALAFWLHAPPTPVR
ncbi:hypothetical protein PPTG_23890 [Phytophthora nicotianae INRA-310]|uniref:Uncharacterized protein n=1 Tax=Phytophthora nicotianae (strain INRA-310) TaxID=761204 RepID=W2PS08_PHYN3|nr:hypothetical protein PPTG_23890 [Phytophthora nicotianae INRA-310]ETN02775.1 hypothetical protein PPTG_23890 [Phytophthora nicotianae INRA-310]